MSRVYLLRHAKAVWASPGMKDFDRPLAAEGIEACKALGIAMSVSGYVPAIVLCSTAKRTRETLSSLNLSPSYRLIESEKLYTQGAETYLKKIRKIEDADSVMLVGHNPTMEDLAIGLCGHGDPRLLSGLNHGFPTAGLAVIDFDGPLAKAKPSKGTLVAFLTGQTG
ncbi:MAG: SixA phosphatase family protein [Phyllobacterium sp.]